MRTGGKLFLACVFVFSSSFLLKMRARNNEGVTITVSVDASDNHPLHYQWRSTDGQISNVNAPTTSWTLPKGPGLHFAYVLVSNGMGGYTERRIAVNTDTLSPESGEAENSDEIAHEGSNSFYAPPGPAQEGDYFRTRVSYFAYLANTSVFLTDSDNGGRYPATGFVKTNERGQAIFAGVVGSGTGEGQRTDDLSLTCVLFGQSSDCGSATMFAYATTATLSVSPGAPLLAGTFTLQDRSPCGTYNEFFGVRSTATATLLDAANNILAGPVDVNEFGGYALPQHPAGVTVLLACEGASHVTVPFIKSALSQLPDAVVAGVNPPAVTNMTASLHGRLLANPVAIFLPPPSTLPSDVAPAPIFTWRRKVSIAAWVPANII